MWSAAAGLEDAAPSQNKTASCEAPLLTYTVTIASFILATQQHSWLGKAHSMNNLLLIVELMEKRSQAQISTGKLNKTSSSCVLVKLISIVIINLLVDH